ncbi:MAG: response regulator transcription factor [Firmicutes bacterium]|nr:response regulator transcription factor [Bacillota bacterium]
MTAVLVVDDEPSIRKLLEFNLRKAGFEPLLAGSGAEAMEILRRRRPDLAIVDLMLPDADGFDLYRRMTAERPLPVLFLTARGGEADRVLGLEMGADDYVVKPFSPRELVARVRAVLRRWERQAEGGRATEIGEEGEERTLRFDGLVIDLSGRRVTRGGRELGLTPKEFDLLAFLARHAGQALSRDRLLEAVWGEDFFGDRRVVDVHVRHLREKVEEDPSHPVLIRTVRGVGYRFGG